MCLKEFADNSLSVGSSASGCFTKADKLISNDL